MKMTKQTQAALDAASEAFYAALDARKAYYAALDQLMPLVYSPLHLLAAAALDAARKAYYAARSAAFAAQRAAAALIAVS